MRKRRRRKTIIQIILPKKPLINIGASTLHNIRGLILSLLKNMFLDSCIDLKYIYDQFSFLKGNS